LLGAWIASPDVTVIERFHSGSRFRDAAIVLKLHKTGAIICVITRKHRESYRGGASTITKARKEERETWGADAIVLGKTRRHKPDRLVIFLTDTEEYFISNYADWFDPTKRVTRTSEHSRKQTYHLPTHLMTHIPSKKSLRPE